MPIYKDFYSHDHEISALRTRDIDFLISRNTKFNNRVDLPALLEDLGFLLDYSYPEGYVKLIHPELIIEFLIQDIGRGTSKPYPLPELGMNAQRLRFLEILERDTIVVNFGLQKLIISSRRKSTEKQAKDIGAGLEVLGLCIDNLDGPKCVELFESFSRKQQNQIIEVLEDNEAEDILNILGVSHTDFTDY